MCTTLSTMKLLWLLDRSRTAESDSDSDDRVLWALATDTIAGRSCVGIPRFNPDETHVERDNQPTQREDYPCAESYERPGEVL